MRKIIYTLCAVVALVGAATATASVNNEYFTPVANSQLRLPSVPLLTSDPFFSVWDNEDHLMDGATVHWCDEERPLLGALRVDGKVYRFLGHDKLTLETVVPMTDELIWEAAVTSHRPSGNWTDPDYDDSAWKIKKAAFGSQGEYPRVNTSWGGNNTDIYVRRTVEINNITDADNLYFVYSHDDDFDIYLNGEKLVGGGGWGLDFHHQLTAQQKKLIRKGKNVIAAHVHNGSGGAYLDMGLYKEKSGIVRFDVPAVQKSCNVMATSSYYTFACGPVELDLVFTAPQLYNNLDLLSTPINYISYRVRSTDKKKHDVQIYFETTPEMAVREESQATVANTFARNGINYAKGGTIDQPICDRTGDQVCADWGYMYVAGINGANRTVGLGDYYAMKHSFISTGTIPAGGNEIRTYGRNHPAMSFCENLGTVTKAAPASGFMMMGYDDVYSIKYMYRLYKGYWAHDGKVSITDAFEKYAYQYDEIMKASRDVDATIFNDGVKAGGNKYAQLLAASYRQVMSAHKLFEDCDGNLMWFSKENNSNGCINTVDLTYPSAPLFLAYNPDLEKAMMTSIFEYARSGRWTKPFAAHDLGTYPIANGQVYNGDMPIEESGNMVILAAAIAKAEGNADYAAKYWDILTTWTNYLVENGLDPTNQLCTDDFAGHWAHNANLSIKAIMGVQAYAELAEMLGKNDVAATYGAKAREMAAKWKEMAADGDHYRLAFDHSNTWSQKYNMVWDVMWNTGLFNDVTAKEISYYLTKQNTYGLPLDCRREYTKNDWIMWTAAMAADVKTFQAFADPVYKYVNETTSRVPISDWHHTDSGQWVSFRARSVIGGYWMQVLKDKSTK
ncbi:MAG: DUF4965 domain-containing protein [Bacteroidales bacterium]|nr:DUF4965 domain-containing protein [Candidatus Sodaliphilus aphodohippi]